MATDGKDPSNAEILTALQGMWRQQGELVQGLERRLGTKIDGVEERLRSELTATEQRLGERLAQEIQDRPVVVHIECRA